MDKKHLALFIVSLVFGLFLLFELICMFLCNGNFIVDTLIFNGFTYCELLDQHTDLKDNQYIIGDTVYTILRDSVDFEMDIDNKPFIKDTLFKEDAYIFQRKNIWLPLGKHSITLKSTALNASYTYSFRCFLFKEIFVESSDLRLHVSDTTPFFLITKHYLPVKRTEL